MDSRTRLIAIAGGAAVLIGGFFYLVNVADNVDPQTAERRIELPDAFAK